MPVAAWAGPLTDVTVRSGRSLSMIVRVAAPGEPATAPLIPVRPSVRTRAPSATVLGCVWMVSVWDVTPDGKLRTSEAGTT